MLLALLGVCCGQSRQKEVSEHPWSNPDLASFLKPNEKAWLVAGLGESASNPASLLSVEERKQLLGYDYTELRSTQWPSKQVIAAHGLRWMYVLMGISCCFFAASFFLYRYLKKKK